MRKFHDIIYTEDKTKTAERQEVIIMKYVVIEDKNGVTNVTRNVENRNARYWLQQSGAQKVWIYTTSGNFVCYGVCWADGSMSVTTNSEMDTIDKKEVNL